MPGASPWNVDVWKFLDLHCKHHPASALQERLTHAEAKQGWQERILARSPSVGGMPATGGSASCAAKWCSSHCLCGRAEISLEECAIAGTTSFAFTGDARHECRNWSIAKVTSHRAANLGPSGRVYRPRTHHASRCHASPVSPDIRRRSSFAT